MSASVTAPRPGGSPSDLEPFWMPFTANRQFKRLRAWWSRPRTCTTRPATDAARRIDHFGVRPELITTAKGLTNGTIPMGAVFARKGIYDAFMDASGDSIELLHGYTYSGHPVAAAAGLATLGVYKEDDLFESSAALAPYWQDAVLALLPASSWNRGRASRRRAPSKHSPRLSRKTC
jgi:hypothetical protein